MRARGLEEWDEPTVQVEQTAEVAVGLAVAGSIDDEGNDSGDRTEWNNQ